MNDDAIKYGILKTRDLVELYFAGRMVVFVKESAFSFTDATPITVILGQDQRRIRYEITIANADPSTPVQAIIGSDAYQQTIGIVNYLVTPVSTEKINREWITDQEAVCLPVEAQLGSGACVIYVRETILTPLPVDETS